MLKFSIKIKIPAFPGQNRPPAAIRPHSVFRIPYFLFFALAYFLSACNVTKHLDDAKGERLLVKNSLELKSSPPLRLNEKTPLMYELGGLFKQKPNEKTLYLFRTRLSLYYMCRNGKGKFSDWIRRRVAEQPTIYDDDLAEKTARNFENFMAQRGYFDAKCTYQTQYIRKHKAKVHYKLDLGVLYTIDQLSFSSPDSNIQHILLKTAGASILRRGAPLDGRAFEAEKLRISTELKNRGYAFFVPNFVEFLGDSTGHTANVKVEVLTESDSSLHQTYTVNRVMVFDLVPGYSSIRRDTTLGGIYFASSEPEFEVRPSRLYNAIAIKPGMPFRQEDFDKTARNLNALGIYRFVSVRPYQDSLQAEKLNVVITIAPNKRLPVGGDLDFNYSNGRASGGLIGLSSSVFLRNRNLLRGAELLQNNLQYNIDFDVTSPARLVFLQEFKFSNDLTFPRFFDYFGLWKAMHWLRLGNTRLVHTELFNRMRAEGRTRLVLTYNYLDINGFYAYNLFNAAFGYDLRPDAQRHYAFDHIGIDVLRPRLRPLFDSLAQNNPFLLNSFSNQLFTGFLMRSFTYNYSGTPNGFGERWVFRLNAEQSGLEEFLLNSAWSYAFGKQTWTLSDLTFSKYLRLEVDGGYTRDFRNQVTVATRIGAGIVAPFGEATDAPYVKQFFVGGPSSIRAWRIRELGPGGNPVNNDIQPFYQAAGFRFEFNGEVRFPLFWWFKGAAFLDGGNIWSIERSETRPNARLGWNSYKNIALGTGIGLRADFSYFVIRFDWGLKLRKPYLNNDTDKYWINWNKSSWRSLSNFNLAVGYPF